MANTNPFISAGSDYALYRPTYPPELAKYLASLCPENCHAVDVGCGNGQFSRPLAEMFDHVIALDPSESQIASAAPHERITYKLSSAEALAVDDNSADLITAAQAAHWFDLPAFYKEAERVAKPGAILALVTYGVPELFGPAGERFNRFYWDDIHAYWPEARRHVETGYQSLHFPYEDLGLSGLSIKREYSFDMLKGYIGTWSAISAARKAGASDLVAQGLEEICEAWGDDPHAQYHIKWPILGRVARLG